MASIPQPAFGLVIPGRPLMEFRPVSPMKYILEVLEPATVTDLTFFMTPAVPLPEGLGAALYFSVPPFENWTTIGAIFNQKPSGVFRTGWDSNPEVATAPLVQLGVSLESLAVVANLELQKSGLEERKHFAHKIALDLFRFMQSFQTDGPQGYLVVPANIFDQWLQRFEAKYRRDPNFMLKIE